MEKKDLELILTHFGPEKEFIGDGYFRIRDKGNEHYEIAYLVPACCGTTNYNPQIAVHVEGDKVVPDSVLDLVDMPAKMLSYSPETRAVMEQELDKLCQKFLDIKGLKSANVGTPD